MNYKIKKITDRKGQTRYELRIWGRGRGAKQMRVRRESKKEALEELDLILSRQSNDQPDNKAEKPKLTFSSEYNYWFERKSPTFSPSWKRTVTGIYSEIKDRIGDLPIENVDIALLSKLEAYYRSRGNGQKTINIKIGMIQSVLNFSYRHERIHSNTTTRFSKTKPPEANREFWEKENAEDFLRFASEKYREGSSRRWIYVVYLAAINSGLRAGEIWALRPRCLKPHQLRITERLEPIDRQFYPPKGKGPRNVPMNAVLESELRRLIEQDRLGRNDMIFRTNAESAVHHRNFCSQIFVKDMNEWNGPRIVFHGLRHTCATLMLDAGLDVKTVQEILGHKDIATTMKYVHLIGKNVTNAALNFSITPAKSSDETDPKLRLVSANFR